MSQTYSVTKVTPLPIINLQYLNEDKENELIPHYETIGGILASTKYVWTANGSQFTVINSKTGVKVAAWNFGSVVKDYSTKVICVDELSRPGGKLPLLVIGLSSAVTGGMICIFEIIGSRVLRAIQINSNITSLHVIDASYDKCPLPGPLRAFDGIVAVGTGGGNVLLLDICRHTCDEVSSGLSLNDIRDEINSCLVKTLFLEDIYTLELYKQVAVRNGEHLAIHLNATDNNVTPHFILKGPKGEDRVHVNKEEVTISALHYCPQLGSLLIGYNFGAWQLWNLIDLQLVYTSPIYEENVPVAYFSIQEPSDDPRAFCYVWVIYSTTEPYHVGFPLAVLYSLNYNSKEWHEGYGILYQDLSSCSVRFQSFLTLLDEDNTDKNIRQGAYCLRLQSINRSMSHGSTLQELHEETVALCSIVWNGWSSSSKIIHTYLSLFDLNQWYKAQMPNSPKLKECGTYMTHICLSKLLPATNNTEPTPFLDVRMDLNTLSQFFGSHKLEEHYYPTSLAFSLCALKKNEMVCFNNPGRQRAFLSNLESTGPSVLIKPTGLYQQSIDLGLYPLFQDTTHNLSLDEQRELILNIALEQQLLSWLCRCVSIWSTGNYTTSGCTLQFLTSWAWQRSIVLKQNADKFTTPLFDYSGLRLDANNHNLLSNCIRQLRNLSMLFNFIVKRFLRFLLHPDIVKERWEALQRVSDYLEVLQWLLNVGLLPECPISSYPRADEFNRISAPYPVECLMKYYDERRTHLQSMNKEQFSTSGSLLFIDNLIELECGGQEVQKQWEESDGNGLYPPPSLQALLRTYLVDGVDITFKHCIVVYVFLDLAMTLDQSRYKPIITHLIKFPAVFQLSPSIIKITQAFWQLDHGDFSTAMEQLLDPLVCAADLKIWHHRVVLKALLAQNQHKFALLYLQVRQPAITEVEDLCTILSLYIVNNMLDEAFHFQRQNRSIKNEGKLLQHFFKECDLKSDISKVIHLPLIQFEEQAFMKYLHDVEHPKLQDLQIFYYLQRSQYIDAFDLNDKLNGNKHKNNKGLKTQENLSFRDVIVKEFTDTLPEISKTLMKFNKQENLKLWKEVARPEPFSVFVHNTVEQAKYKSTLINTVLSKAKETWTHPILDVTVKDDNVTYPITEEMPFFNTPKAFRTEPRVATPVIFPRMIVDDCEEYGPSPAKRFKPSPRLSTSGDKKKLSVMSINIDVTCDNLSVRLDTPIVKRKVAKKVVCSDEKDGMSVNSINTDLTCKNLSVKLDTPVVKRKLDKGTPSSLTFSDVGTPQSILKVYNLVRNSQSPIPVTLQNTINAEDDVDATPIPQSRKISFGLTPRKPLPRTPRYGVRFDISRGSSESSLTSEPSYEIIQEEAMVHSSLEGSLGTELKTSEVNSKNSSLSVEDSFYSPDASIGSNTDSKPTSLQSIVEIDECTKVLDDSITDSPRTRSLTRHLDEILGGKVELTPAKPASPPKTPKSRRSYRDLHSEVAVRSSPRLRRSQTPEIKEPLVETKISTPGVKKITEILIPETKSEESPKAGRTPKSKIRGRRPLSRQVLENNAFAIISEALVQAAPQIAVVTEDLTDKFDDSNSADSTNVSYNQLNIACASETVLEPSSEEASVKSEGSVEHMEVEEDAAVEIHEYVPDNNEQEENNETVVIEPDLLDTANIYDDLSSDNYGSADPQMNVFEISDDLDLDFNEGCVEKPAVDTLEIDINYTTSVNDEEVFADNSEVLTDLMPVEYNLEQIEAPEAYVDNPADTNEVIELLSSSEENQESSDDEFTEGGSLEEEGDEESIHKEDTTCSSEDAGLGEENIEESNKGSDSDYSRNSELMSDDHEEEISYEDFEEPLNVAVIEEDKNDDEQEILFEVSKETLNPAVIEEDKNDHKEEITFEVSNEPLNAAVIEEDKNDNKEEISLEVSKKPLNLAVIEEEIAETKEINSKSIELPMERSKSPHVTKSVTVVLEPLNLEENLNVKKQTIDDEVPKENLEESISDIDDPSLNLNQTNDSSSSNERLMFLSQTQFLKFLDRTSSDEVLEDNSNKSTPARRSTRLSSLQPSTPESITTARRTRRSSSFDIAPKTIDLSQPSTSKDNRIVEVPLTRHLKTRSNSAEVLSFPKTKRTITNTETKPSQKRTLRSNSTDPDIKKSETTTRNRRAVSVHVDLPVIKEEVKSKQKDVKLRKTKSTITAIAGKSKVEAYSTSRRLTRRQAALLEKNLGTTKMDVEIPEEPEHSRSESEDSDVEERGPKISQLDPIHLLDKPGFEGKRDSEEEINQSPGSSVPESPIGSRSNRRFRSKSTISNTSPRSEVSTVASSASRKLRLAKHPIGGISTRTKRRSKSVDETSKMPSPPKSRKTNRGAKDQDSGSDISSVSKTRSLIETKSSTMAKRTRSASLHLENAGQGESPLRRSERRSVLPQIIEEQNSTPVKKVGRPKRGGSTAK